MCQGLGPKEHDEILEIDHNNNDPYKQSYNNITTTTTNSNNNNTTNNNNNYTFPAAPPGRSCTKSLSIFEYSLGSL